MAFTSWDDEITKVKNRLSELTEDLSTMLTKGYSTGEVSAQKRAIKELQDYLEFCQEQKAKDSSGEPSAMVSYGRHRRFR